MSPGAIVVGGSTLRTMLSSVYNVNRKRIECPAPLDHQRFALVVAAPNQHRELIEPLAQQAFETTFGMKTRYQTQNKEVFVLEAPDGPASGLRQSPDDVRPSRRIQDGLISVVGGRVRGLCELLEEKLGKTVTDNTDLGGRYDYELKYTEGKPQSLIQAVHDHLGLKLTRNERIVEMLLVEPSPTPAISVDKLRSPDGSPVDLKSLRGKLVVLNFWASWCAPCVEAVPHLNDLAAKFQRKDVQFVVITPERESEIKAFLQKKPLQTWVGIDPDQSTFDAYHVTTIPRTVIINRNGYVAGTTAPTLVTARIIDALLAGDEITIPHGAPSQSVVAIKDRKEPAHVRPMYQMLIKQMEKHRGTFTDEDGIWRGEAVTLKDALALAYDVTPSRIASRSPLSKRGYQIIVAAPEGYPDMRAAMLRNALKETFDLVVSRETVDKETFVLSAPDPKALKIRKTSSEDQPVKGREAGRVTARNRTITALASQLEAALGKPVLDDTGLKGKYDWDLTFDAGKPTSIVQAVEAALGLKLTPVKRTVEVLVVEMPEHPSKRRKK